MTEPASGGLIAVWDTCTLQGVIALARGDELLSETHFRTEKGHTGSLLPLLDGLLSGAGSHPADLAAVAAGAGPGNFTGVKVGVSTAKGMALALAVPVAALSPLDALAEGAPGADLVVACMDARRGQYYAAAYRGGDTTDILLPHSCLEPEPLLDALLALPGGTVTLAGEGPPSLEGGLRAAGREVIVHPGASPQAPALVTLAGRALSLGKFESAVSLTPVYLKRPV